MLAFLKKYVNLYSSSFEFFDSFWWNYTCGSSDLHSLSLTAYRCGR